MLDEEIKRVRAEFKKQIDAAATRLREKGAPESQINQLKSKLGGWEAENQGRVGARFGAIRAFGGVRGQRSEPPEKQLFNALQQQFPRGGSGSSSGGPRKYSSNFRGNPVSGEIRRDGDVYSFKATDSGISISVSDAAGFIELTLESDSGLLSITQLPEGPATALLIGGGKVHRVSGDDYTSMLIDNIDELREHFFPLTSAVGVTGLDPLSEAMVGRIVDRLKNQLPENLDAPVTVTDSIVFPLLTDQKYLAKLAEQLSGDDLKLVQQRLEAISTDKQ